MCHKLLGNNRQSHADDGQSSIENHEVAADVVFIRFYDFEKIFRVTAAPLWTEAILIDC